MKEGWERKTLGEVCEFINRGVSPKYVDQKGLAVLNQRCIRNHKIYYEFSRFHDNKFKQVDERKLIQPGDVLVNSTGTGTLGRVAQVKRQVIATVDSHVTIVRPLKQKFYSDFFGYAMTSIEEDIEKGGEGCGGQTELSRDKLKNNYFICYPQSLSEQKRIVAILDEAFASIAKAKANVEKNLQNAKELFESFLQNALENESNQWQKKTLQEIVHSECTLSYGIVQPGDEYPNGLPIVRPTDLAQKFVNLTKLKLIDPQLSLSYKKTILRGNELLLCVRGTTGTISMSTPELKGANVTRGIVPVWFNEKLLNLQFGYYLFMSRYFKDQIKEKTYGAALQQINIGDLRKLLVIVPPLNVQKRIVTVLEKMSFDTSSLQTIYLNKLDFLNQLKKSILQKAFNGELTASSKILVP